MIRKENTLFKKLINLISQKIKGQKKKTKKFGPIVFVNKPIETPEYDAIGFEAQIDSVNAAIDNGANMIGVIADYGTGKSSLTDLLCVDQSRYEKAIKINMWDCLQEHTKQDNSENNPTLSEITNLTKSFLFQLASGVTDRKGKSKLASHINKRLSKNYSIISFSVLSTRLWFYFGFSAFVYSLYLILDKITIESLSMFLYSWFNNTNLWINILWINIIKDFSPMLFVASIILLVLGLKDTSIAFSNWKNQVKREIEVNDVFDIYHDIADNLFNKCKKDTKQLIIVEDLDRIVEKPIIIGFLRELYRFQNLLSVKLKKKIVFIVAMKPEPLLKPEKDKEYTIEDNIYAKIFDFTIVLKPIHFEDYENVILSIINSDKTGAKTKLEQLLEEKTENKLPESFYWIKKGQNLTVRDIKDRLNKAISLLVSLKNKKYEVKSSANFHSCAAVTYLESQYGDSYYELIKKEDAFANIIRASYSIRNSDTENKKEELSNRIETLVKGKKDYQKFTEDLAEMILLGTIDDDFRMYFYSYPRGSYIKTSDEKDISNLLLLPHQFPDDEDLGEKVKRIVEKDSNDNIIIKCFNKYGEDEKFPLIILQNEHLFRYAISNNKTKMLNLVHSELSWDTDHPDMASNMLKTINNYDFEAKEWLYKEYTKELIKELLNYDSSHICKVRKSIIQSIGENISHFNGLFFEDTSNAVRHSIPIISEDELNAIGSIRIALTLIDIPKIDRHSIVYIANRINSQPLDPNDYSYCNGMLRKVCQSIPDEVVEGILLDFMMVNNSVDDKFFAIIAKQYIENSKDTAKICEYINNIDISKISDNYLKLLDQLEIRSGLKSEILNKLEANNYYYSYLFNLYDKKQLNNINFRDERVYENIIKDCMRINAVDGDVIIEIRKAILKSALTSINKYRDLFYGGYSLITKEEMNCFDKFSDAVEYINGTKVSSVNCTFIWEYSNQDNRTAEECFALLKKFSNESDDYISDPEAIINIIYNVDFNKVEFCNMSEEQKEKSASILQSSLHLNTTENCMKFMRKVNCLIPSLESIVQKQATNNEYVDLINELNMPTDRTIKWISEQTVLWPLEESITNKLLENKLYSSYIIGKTLRDNQFTFDLSIISITEYIKVFIESDKVYEIMAREDSFLNAVVFQDLYKNFNITRLKKLYRMRQPISLFIYLFKTLDQDQFEEYLNSFEHLNTKEDSAAFVKFICTDDHYLKFKSKNIREAAYSKLWQPVEKQKFTKFMKAKYPEQEEESSA